MDGWVDMLLDSLTHKFHMTYACIKRKEERGRDVNWRDG